MSYPTTYTWTLDTGSFSAPPSDGAGPASAPSFGKRRRQFERGIKFANVPDSRADAVVHGGPRVWHVNAIMPNTHSPIDRSLATDPVVLSGVVSTNNKDRRPPSSVRRPGRAINRFGNETYFFTGEWSPRSTIALSLFVDDVDSTDAVSYVAGTLSPTSGSIMYLAVASSSGTAGTTINTPTVTGGGQTWTAINTIQTGSATGAFIRLTVFRASSSTPAVSDLTFSFGGQAQKSIAYAVLEAFNMDTTGVNGAGSVVQSVSASVATTAVLNPYNITTLSGFEFNRNANVTFIAAASSSILKDNDFLEMSNTNALNETIRLVCHTASNQLVCSPSMSGPAGSQFAMAISFELKCGLNNPG